mmetsp:Transcript_48419/g.114857  ORF Transcript_48419/g.114857 Transcript_48419/m.114857 type:complete len:309 (+) Transcript_48419:443-1369(+)
MLFEPCEQPGNATVCADCTSHAWCGVSVVASGLSVGLDVVLADGALGRPLQPSRHALFVERMEAGERDGLVPILVLHLADAALGVVRLLGLCTLEGRRREGGEHARVRPPRRRLHPHPRKLPKLHPRVDGREELLHGLDVEVAVLRLGAEKGRHAVGDHGRESHAAPAVDERDRAVGHHKAATTHRLEGCSQRSAPLSARASSLRLRDRVLGALAHVLRHLRPDRGADKPLSAPEWTDEDAALLRRCVAAAARAAPAVLLQDAGQRLSILVADGRSRLGVGVGGTRLCSGCLVAHRLHHRQLECLLFT